MTASMERRGGRVVITGCLGNLGWKLTQHLLVHGEFDELVGLDLRVPSEDQTAALEQLASRCTFRLVTADLTDWNDERWRKAITGADAVVHFAARNPFPEATWEESIRSLDMTLHVALASADAGIRRFVFASSNHVMGRYKDEPLAGELGASELTTDLAYEVGTRWITGNQQMDSTAYSVAKSSGERLLVALGERGPRTTFVCVRVGWCQPGDNLPSTLSAAGTPTQQQESTPETLQGDEWYRRMWLSNRDFCQLFERAIGCPDQGWPARTIIVNGISNNHGTRWSLAEAKDHLGYEPRDGLRRD